MCHPEAPFYLQVHPSWDREVNGQPTQVWFKNQPLGEHSLGNMMKQMAHQAELPGHKTNHSGRKTTVKRLKEANFENTDIIQVTGHKNVQSLNSYCTVPQKIMKKMSATLTTYNAEAIEENKENLDFPDIPSHELEEILSCVEVVEQSQKENVSYNPKSSEIQLSSSHTLNKALGMGTSMLSGANISGGNFTININFGTK